MRTNYFEYVDNYIVNYDTKSKCLVKSSITNSVKYTIAIPTYRRLDLLEEALKSALNQTTNEVFEVIVVDNDSENEEVKKMLDKYSGYPNLCYYRNEKNIGMFGNWNRCIELANGDFITILNDDDLLSPNYLERCDLYLAERVDGIYFRNNEIKNVVNNKRLKYVLFKKIIGIFAREKHKLSLFDFFLGNMSAGTLGVMFKKDLLIKLGGYNPRFFPSSDYVLHANYCNSYNVYFINEKLNYYRIEDNESAKQETLMMWEQVDYEIRTYFINFLRLKWLMTNINKIIQNIRVRGLVNNWGYKTDTLLEYKLKHRLFERVISLKKHLNV